MMILMLRLISNDQCNGTNKTGTIIASIVAATTSTTTANANNDDVDNNNHYNKNYNHNNIIIMVIMIRIIILLLVLPWNGRMAYHECAQRRIRPG